MNLGKAMAQAVGDCGDAIPYVAHRKNLGDWMVTVRADDLVAFAGLIVGADDVSKMKTWRYGNA